MRHSRWKKSWVSILLFWGLICWNTPLAVSADVPDKKEILAQAKQAYYSLADKGFAEFRATARINWEKISTTKALDAQVKEAFGRIHYRLFVDSGAFVIVEDATDRSKFNESSKKSLDMMHSEASRSLNDFFAMWSLFMLKLPFPAPDRDYEMTLEGDDQYNISYKEKDTYILISMTRDFMIDTLHVVNPFFSILVKPQLARSSQGFVLTGYQDLDMNSMRSRDVSYKVNFESRQINGLIMPVLLKMNRQFDFDPPEDIEITLTDCQVKKSTAP